MSNWICHLLSFEANSESLSSGASELLEKEYSYQAVFVFLTSFYVDIGNALCNCLCLYFIIFGIKTL